MVAVGLPLLVASTFASVVITAQYRAWASSVERAQAASQAAMPSSLPLLAVVLASAIGLATSLAAAWQIIRYVLAVTMRVTERTRRVNAQLLVPTQEALQRLTRGQFDGLIDDALPLLAIDSHDELGVMAASLDEMIGISCGTGATVATLQERMRALVHTSRQMADAAVAGTFLVRADPDQFEGEFRTLVQELNRMLDAIHSPLAEAKDALQAMASRNLEMRMRGDYKGDYNAIAESVNRAAEQLSGALRQVRSSVYTVADTAALITTTSETLAGNAERQSSAIDAVDRATKDLAQRAERVARSAAAVTTLAGTAREQVQTGTRVAGDLGDAITRIKSSSDATSRVVKTIDEIAFQTNLLALNAAVEAARAGDAGRGFAVVADEVRALALRSAEAARSTGAMIDAAVHEADRGVLLRDDVQRVLSAIASAVEQVDETAASMTMEITVQRDQVRDIAGRMSELTNLARSVATGAKEGAQGAEQMRQQASALGDAAKGFKIFDVSGSAPKSGPALAHSLGLKVGPTGSSVNRSPGLQHHPAAAPGTATCSAAR